MKSPRITALLTGRGGSSLKDKNVRQVLGKPALYYPAKAALDSQHITDHFTSSDDEKILAAAEELGYTRIVRPAEIAKDTAQHRDVILHALDEMERVHELKPDILVVLLANCVALKTAWINECIEYLLEEPELTCAAPAYEYPDHHPYRARKIREDGLVEPFFDFAEENVSSNRQDLVRSCFFCQNFWVLRTATIHHPEGHKPWTFMGNKVKPYLVDTPHVDVHTEEDLLKSEEWLRLYGN